MSSSLLLVEDDNSLGATLKERLEKESYSITWVQTLAEADEEIQKKQYALIILDVGLPDGSGFDFAKKVRKEQTTPFLFVTAMASAADRLQGFEIGAEEYIPKPFHLKELLLRVRHVLEKHPVLQRLRFENIVLDFDKMALEMPGGKSESLPKKDFELLRLLITSSPRVVSRDEILNQVWGEESFPTNRTVDNVVVRLRNILGDDGSRFIKSVRGVGYQWLAKYEVDHG